jgi:hypothetical protein
MSKPRKKRCDAGKPRAATVKELFAMFARLPASVRATIPAALEALDEALAQRELEIFTEEPIIRLSTGDTDMILPADAVTFHTTPNMHREGCVCAACEENIVKTETCSRTFTDHQNGRGWDCTFPAGHAGEHSWGLVDADPELPGNCRR